MDHLSIPIANATRTRLFYEAALHPLGWTCSGWRENIFVAFKKLGSPALYLNVSSEVVPVHLAFRAQTEIQIGDFYRNALNAGGSDNGPPGARPDFGQSYFAAFVLDPDGHNIEAVLGGVWKSVG